MNKIKLRGKFVIGLSIMSVILIGALVYSSLSLNNVQGNFEALQQDYIPQVEVAKDIQSSVSRVWATMTKYGVTGDLELLAEGRRRIDVLFESIQSGEAVIGKAEVDMSLLSDELSKMKASLAMYQGQIQETEATFAIINTSAIESEKQGALFLENAYGFLDSESNLLNEAIRDGGTQESMASHLEKMNLIEKVIETGNQVRLTNLTARANNDYAILIGLSSEIDTMSELMNEVVAIGVAPSQQVYLQGMSGSILQYKTAVEAIISANETINTLRNQREVTLTEVITSANTISDNGLDITKTTTDDAISQLGSTITVIIIVFILGIVIGFLINMWIVNKIVRQIKKLNEGANKLALGDVNVQIDASGADELADLGRSFNNMIHGISRQVEVAEQIAQGNINVAIDVRSEDDLLNIKLKEMSETIQSLLAEMDLMVERLSIGDFGARAVANHYKGGWNQLASGVNGIMDVVSGFFDEMPTLIMFADKEFNVRYMNKTAASVVGSSKTNVISQKCYDLFKTDDCNSSDCASGVCMQTLTTKTSETQAHINGKDIDIKYTGTPLYSRSGELEGFMEIVVDQTSVMQAQRKAEKQAIYQDNEVAKLQIDLENLAQGILTVSAQTALGDEDTKELKTVFDKIYGSLGESVTSIRSYISEMSEILGEMSEGNLVVEISRDYKGEFVTIKDAINMISDSLNRVLGEISLASEQVAAGSKQVSDSSQALSRGASDQMSSVEEITSSLTEVSEQTTQNAENAALANDLALKAKLGAEVGNAQMKETLQAMNDINESSASISAIIKVIDEIAFQTNILALNAAVEAARAGEHGKGFAVVAEEVRNLAARSANAAKETTVMIENSVSKAKKGTEIAKSTAEALAVIVEGVTKAANIVDDIALASKEQAMAINQITQGVEQISKVTQMNTATAEESASASEELLSQSELTQEMVSQFKLKVIGIHANQQFNKLKNHKKTKQVHYATQNSYDHNAVINLDSEEFGKF